MNYQKQANDFAAKHGVKLQILSSRWGSHFSPADKNRCIFKVKLSRKGRSYTFDFGQSIADGNTPPTMYDILACLTKTDPGSYSDFCNNFGFDMYDENTGKIEKESNRIYKAVCNEFKNVDRLFSDIIEELYQIQ